MGMLVRLTPTRSGIWSWQIWCWLRVAKWQREAFWAALQQARHFSPLASRFVGSRRRQDPAAVAVQIRRGCCINPFEVWAPRACLPVHPSPRDGNGCPCLLGLRLDLFDVAEEGGQGHAMAWRYIKMGICGTAVANRREEDEIQAAAIVAVVGAGTKRRWGGSVVGRAVKNRERGEIFAQIMRDYFVDSPLYGDDLFRRRFRMRKFLFLRIVDDLTARNRYFRQKTNVAWKKGFHPIHKCLVAMRMLAYGGAADALDDTYKMAESTVLETLMEFVTTVVDVYGEEYLRPPNARELEVILRQNEARGFPGMIGSIDCMHWEWENCPTALTGMYKGHKAKPTLILEAVATQDLRIWHAFFGLPGSHNDINVLHRSPVFDDLAHGRTPEVEFWVNGNPYTMGYYPADGIYPDWATLVKTASTPVSMKHKVFAAAQEACRKDVERAFGVLQAKFKIIHNPARLWKQGHLNTIMLACVILHNMVIEDERNIYLNPLNIADFEGPEDPPVMIGRDVPEISQLIDAYRCMKNKETCHQLQQDLIDNIWAHYGSSTGPFAGR